MKRNILILLTVLLLAMSMAACAGPAEVEVGEEPVVEEEPAEEEPAEEEGVAEEEEAVEEEGAAEGEGALVGQEMPPSIAAIEERKETMVDTSQYRTDPPWRIAHASQGPTNSWALMYDAHFEWALDQYGDQIEQFLYADANGSADKQLNDIEDLLAQNPDVLVITPMGRAALVGPVERAMAEGIPVVLCASGVDTDNFVTEIGHNLWELGQNKARWLAEELGGEGSIFMMSGIAGVDTAETQKAAALALFESEYPNIEILGDTYGEWSTSTAKRVAESFLVGHPEIDGVFSDGAQMSVGIIEAFVEAGREPPPITAEGLNGFLRVADEHDVPFYAESYPNAMGALCADTAVRVLQGESVPHYIEVAEELDVPVFTNEELGEYYLPECSDDMWVDFIFPREVAEELGMCE
ncbi:MAG: substrate-binding domain-containing protein [Chloroflexota bacterium]|nr:substrate-binding domain-containing protein [Chloroflexota bacterium]